MECAGLRAARADFARRRWKRYRAC